MLQGYLRKHYMVEPMVILMGILKGMLASHLTHQREIRFIKGLQFNPLRFRL